MPNIQPENVEARMDKIEANIKKLKGLSPDDHQQRAHYLEVLNTMFAEVQGSLQTMEGENPKKANELKGRELRLMGARDKVILDYKHDLQRKHKPIPAYLIGEQGPNLSNNIPQFQEPTPEPVTTKAERSFARELPPREFATPKTSSPLVNHMPEPQQQKYSSTGQIDKVLLGTKSLSTLKLTQMAPEEDKSTAPIFSGTGDLSKGQQKKVQDIQQTRHQAVIKTLPNAPTDEPGGETTGYKR